MYFNFTILSLLLFLFLFIFFLFLKINVFKAALISSFIFYLIWLIRLGFWSFPDIQISLKPYPSNTHQTLNFIFLLPLGFYLVFLFKIKNPLLLFIITIIIPFSIEIGQDLLIKISHRFIYHTFSYEDVYFNFLGLFLSSFLSLLGYKIRTKYPRIKQ